MSRVVRWLAWRLLRRWPFEGFTAVLAEVGSLEIGTFRSLAFPESEGEIPLLGPVPVKGMPVKGGMRPIVAKIGGIAVRYEDGAAVLYGWGVFDPHERGAYRSAALMASGAAILAPEFGAAMVDADGVLEGWHLTGCAVVWRAWRPWRRCRVEVRSA